MKIKVERFDVDILESVPVDLSRLSDVVKNGVVKNGEYNPEIKNIEDKLLRITSLATNITLNTKIINVKGKIPSITNLTTTTAFNAVDNQIPNLINLVKKANYNTKINEIEKKLLIAIMINILVLTLTNLI